MTYENDFERSLALVPLGPREVRARATGLLELAPTEQLSALQRALARAFGENPELVRIELELSEASDLRAEFVRRGLALETHDARRVDCRRSTFFQLPEPWLVPPFTAPYPFEYVVSQGKRHPRRPPLESGTRYRRRVPHIDATVSFRTLSLAADLPTFHRWMNEPRVSAFWELEGSLDRHREYLTTLGRDAHVHPVIGCIDAEPFGYFELYWAKEDRIAPYYAVDDYDRGLHMLVGAAEHRGPEKVAAWLPSLAHFLFLEDPRTQNVVAEPRSDNAKMIRYLERAGFHKTKEFDFPHKRAAMMVLSREAFFGQFCP